MNFKFLRYFCYISICCISCNLDNKSLTTKYISYPLSSDFCKKDSDISSIGNPTSIDLPTTANEIYETTTPTYFELNGVNVNRGNERHFSEMEELISLFSHARTFHFMNKDYWDDGIGQANGNDPSTLRKYDPKEISRLKLLVDINGRPLERNEYKEGDKLIYFDSNTETLNEKGLKPGFYNVYDNYLNQNWIYQKNVSEQFNGHLQITLTTVGGNFPKSIQSKYNFPNQWFRDEDWGEDIRLSAKAYAMLFARAYAPNDRSYKICETLEIGNEPWGLKPETYQKIVEGFVEGFTAYYGKDFLIKLLPAAFQGNHKENNRPANFERANWKDYFGTRLNTESKCQLAGINIHNYSNDLNDSLLRGWFKERLIATPEQSSSTFLYARNAWLWVNKNMPPYARNIYASEYGWDTRNDCKEKINATAVGEAAQGIYVTRALLLLSRMGVHRANVFELLDDSGQNPCQFAYHSSGFYSLQNNKALPKKSVQILQDFITRFGHLRFNQVLVESNDFYLFELTDGEVNYLVGWLPENINNMSLEEINNITKTVSYKKQKFSLSPIPKIVE
jgi:hypothetical protein